MYQFPGSADLNNELLDLLISVEFSMTQRTAWLLLLKVVDILLKKMFSPQQGSSLTVKRSNPLFSYMYINKEKMHVHVIHNFHTFMMRHCSDPKALYVNNKCFIFYFAFHMNHLALPLKSYTLHACCSNNAFQNEHIQYGALYLTTSKPFSSFVMCQKCYQRSY